jgi:hypothetical protein
VRGIRALRTSILAGVVASVTFALVQPGVAGASRSSRALPAGFIGMNADGALFSVHVNFLAQLKLMRSSGTSSLRMTFNWSQAQPYASWKDVPSARTSQFTDGPGGVPTDFQGTDLVIGAAALRGISLTPVVVYAPKWDSSPNGNHVQPAHDKPYAEYLSALVKRYGSRGTFWQANPKIPKHPVVRWQIWNEPELGYFWDTKPFAPSYVKLLRAAHGAIKAADPKATVVLAALTNHSWDDLKAIYKVSGSRSLFDLVAADAYTRSARGVITILGYVRQVMNQYGDSAKQLTASEVGWPAAVGKTQKQFGFDTNSKGQASKLSQLMPLLAKNRHKLNLESYFYYTWMSSYRRGAASPFAFSGLLRRHGKQICAEPAFSVFRKTALSEEGRQPNGSTPRRCAR